MPELRRLYKVDILIRGYGNIARTRRLLNSIERHTPQELYQVTYVDNGSDLHEAAQLMAEFPEVVFVRLPFNHGSVRGINHGLASALLSPAEYVILLDNDTEIPKGDTGWLERWLSFFDNDTVGAVGAVGNYVAGHQHCESVPDFYNKAWQDGARSGLKEQPDFPVLVSFALAFRKAVINKLGWFDERYEPGNYEDYDYILRMREAGWQARIATSVWIHHMGSQTFKQFGLSNLLHSNGMKLLEKWGATKLNALGLTVRVPATT